MKKIFLIQQTSKFREPCAVRAASTVLTESGWVIVRDALCSWKWSGCLSNKWQMGDPDVMSSAASWFGSAIFLIVAVTVIQSFFGIGFILPLFDAALNFGSMFLDTMTAFLQYMSSYLKALPSFEINALSSITPSKLPFFSTTGTGIEFSKNLFHTLA